MNAFTTYGTGPAIYDVSVYKPKVYSPLGICVWYVGSS